MRIATTWVRRGEREGLSIYEIQSQARKLLFPIVHENRKAVRHVMRELRRHSDGRAEGHPACNCLLPCLAAGFCQDARPLRDQQDRNDEVTAAFERRVADLTAERKREQELRLHALNAGEPAPDVSERVSVSRGIVPPTLGSGSRHSYAMNYRLRSPSSAAESQASYYGGGPRPAGSTAEAQLDDDALHGDGQDEEEEENNET